MSHETKSLYKYIQVKVIKKTDASEVVRKLPTVQFLISSIQLHISDHDYVLCNCRLVMDNLIALDDTGRERLNSPQFLAACKEE